MSIRQALTDLHNNYIEKERLTDAEFLKLTKATKYSDEMDHMLVGDEKDKTDALTPEEQRIRGEEYKAVLIQDHLKRFLSDNIEGRDIGHHNYWTRFMKTYPEAKKNWDRITVTQDSYEWVPTLYNLTYCSLELSRIQIYSMAFVLFERALDGNTMIAVLILAIAEYLLKQIRHSLA